MKNFFKKDENNEIEKETDEITKWEVKIKRKDLKYETKNYMYNFRQYETIRSFGDKIYTSNINIDDAEMDESSLLKIS